MAEAMDVGDEVIEGNIPSLIRGSIETMQKGEVLSPDDISWADCCLIEDYDIWGHDWNTLKGALLDILDSQQEAPSSSATVSDPLPRKTYIETLPSREGEETDRFQKRTLHNLLHGTEKADKSDDDMPTNEDASNSQSFTFMGNPFLPGYIDELRVTENLELGSNVGSLVSEREPSTDDIFRVWDLDVEVEEDELVKQLNKALEEGLPQSKAESVDDLVAGFTDMSLHQNPS